MYKLINIGTQANSQIREYIADTEDDIATLPDSDPFGSTVFVIETSATYMKNSAGEYMEVVVPGGGGGGSVTVDDALSGSSTNPVQNKIVKVALDAVNAPYEITGVINVETGAITLSNITAAELYAAAVNGKLFKTTADYGGATIELCGSVLAQKIYDQYYFAMYDPEGRFMVTGRLNGTDVVVFSLVS